VRERAVEDGPCVVRLAPLLDEVRAEPGVAAQQARGQPAFALQFVVLRKWRLEMIGQVDASMARRRQEKQQLRAALAGEEKPPEDGDQATR